jgi:hypothetical protein
MGGKMYSKNLCLADRLQARPTGDLLSGCNLGRHWPVTQVGTEPQLVVALNMSVSEVEVVSAQICDVHITTSPEKLS